jgi:hypothetical protein
MNELKVGFVLVWLPTLLFLGGVVWHLPTPFVDFWISESLDMLCQILGVLSFVAGTYLFLKNWSDADAGYL